jgi:hypothetical protein
MDEFCLIFSLNSFIEIRVFLSLLPFSLQPSTNLLPKGEFPVAFTEFSFEIDHLIWGYVC